MSAPMLLLPGLGADSGLFTHQLNIFDNARVPDWPSLDGVKTVEDLASRLFDDLQKTDAWGGGVTLVGFSFGGQVALSLALHALGAGAPPMGVALISSPRSPAQLTGAFKAQASIARWIPDGVMWWAAARLVTPRFAKASSLTPAQTDDLRAMAKRLDARQFKALAKIATGWSFDAAQERRLLDAGVKIEHLHSERDFVIPPPPASTPGVELIPERAHLLTWTHAERVETLIRRVSD